MDVDGFSACEECDDTSTASFPGAIEVCDGVDNDCDGTTDLGAADVVTWYADVDGDGYGDSTTSVIACSAPDDGGTYVTDGADCDDTKSSFHPGAEESDCADANDYNCDGGVGYEDLDGDGAAACEDCDDANPAAFPSAAEVCDGADNDCDGTADAGTIDAPTWFADDDLDTFGDPEAATVSCLAPAGSVTEGTDCDDTDGAVNPDAIEICDDVDNDCDTTTDVNTVDASTWYADEDGDEFGDAAVTQSACDAPINYVADSTDCDDDNADVYPGAPEICDDLDNACNGIGDDLTGLWFADGDDDSFGDPAIVSTDCAAPSRYVADSTDCDDTDSGDYPGAAETVGNGDDEDCDGQELCYDDDDDDGYLDATGDTLASSNLSCADANEGTDTDLTTDCDDARSGVHPGAIETCATAYDDDCDGGSNDPGATSCTTRYYDSDGDTYGTLATECRCTASGDYGAIVGTDCDDSDAGDYPGAFETVGNEDDEDCDGSEICYADADDDGYLDTLGDTLASADATCNDAFEGSVTDPTTDCEDGVAGVNPGAVEICDDLVDNDCDGVADAADGDCGTSFADYTTVWGGEMIAITAGSYSMGSGLGDQFGNYTDHTVTLTHDFWIGETEVTRSQWESWSGGVGWAYSTTYPCTGTTANCPTNDVSWYDMAKFANALSTAEGLTPCYLADGTDLEVAYVTDPYACPGYRLPTEAEWEYAARAGEDTMYSGSNTVDDVAWWHDNTQALGTFSHEVAMLAPNAWGLYDMSGNQYEWTHDWFSGSYDGYGTGSAITDPPGPTYGTSRVTRGGAWSYWESDARVAYRDYYAPSSRWWSIGGRLSRSIP